MFSRCLSPAKAILVASFVSVQVFLPGGLAPTANAQDLTDIKRAIAKEPDYETESQKYCLVAFGPDAKTLVWLVQDGGTLYVDRNANGDLTEAGEQVAPYDPGIQQQPGEYRFDVGEISTGGLLHKGFSVYVSDIERIAQQYESVGELLAAQPDAQGYMLHLNYQHPDHRGYGIEGRIMQSVFFLDNNGVFQFSETPAEAPIVHFGGPLQSAIYYPQKLPTNRALDLTLGVGTPGLGPGTTAWVNYGGVIPDDVYPTVEITFTGEDGNPIIERYELPKRC